jgi:glycosyltransferase involved in cell wall biosynthesis
VTVHPPRGGGQVDLSLVVPFYNPGPVVRQTVERAASALDACGIAFEIIGVSDGSTDGSAASLDGLLPGVVHTVALDTNHGKGYAVRAGMERARGRFVGFIDADGDIPPEILKEFVAVAMTQSPDIVFGSKRHPDSEVNASVVRRLSSLGYRWLVSVLFDLSVPDTQTGIKLLRAEVVAAALSQMTENRFAFDLELFLLARSLGFDAWVDLPVRVDKGSSSTVSLRAAGSIVVDTMNIYWKLIVSPASRRSRRNQRHPKGPIGGSGGDGSVGEEAVGELDRHGALRVDNETVKEPRVDSPFQSPGWTAHSTRSPEQ